MGREGRISAFSAYKIINLLRIERRMEEEMKKILVAALATMAISTSCFAAGAAGNFGKEEKAADLFVEALTGTTTTYAQASKGFSSELGKQLTEANFDALKKQIGEKIGKIDSTSFVAYNKGYDLKKGYSGMEELIYLGKLRGDKYARISVVFIIENNVPKIADFIVNPIENQPSK